MPKFLPNIDDYLEQNSYGSPVSVEGLEKLIYKIVVHTGLKYETCEFIVKYFFNEIRNSMLRGEIVNINKIGKLFIRCPKNGTGKKYISTVIKLTKKLSNKIKYDD
jgi:nucleoid DNA-binding protein